MPETEVKMNAEAARQLCLDWAVRVSNNSGNDDIDIIIAGAEKFRAFLVEGTVPPADEED